MKVSYGSYQTNDKTFSATPRDWYRQFKIKARKRDDHNAFVAPEHYKFAKNMDRAFPLDHDGRPMKELGKRLVLDPRPEIMQPKRIPIFLGLDQSCS